MKPEPLSPLLFLISCLSALSFASSHVDIRVEAAHHHNPENWIGWGGSNHNTRHAASNKAITAAKFAQNKTSVHCHLTKGSVSATATIIGHMAYIPVWNGEIVALDYEACQVKWTINATAHILAFAPRSAFQAGTGVVPGSRTTPQVDLVNRILYFGTQLHCLVFAADLDTGAILGHRQIETHDVCTITGSPSLVGDTLLVGTSSAESSVVQAKMRGIPGPYGECCTFIGRAFAIKFARGKGKARNKGTFTIKWSVAMLPEPDSDPSTAASGTWSGSAIWGSQPAVDAKRNQVFFATGQSYTAPEHFMACTADPTAPGCELPERVWQEAVVAIDLSTGKVNWVAQLNYLDVFVQACYPGFLDVELCPALDPATGYKVGPDFDFPMQPSFIPGGGKKKQDVLVVGQKSGVIWSLDARTGNLVWRTQAAPGSPLNGLTWGIAVDGKRAYFSGSNWEGAEWALKPGAGGNATSTRTGFFGAVDVKTGEVIWTTPVGRDQYSLTVPAVVGDVVINGRVNHALDLLDPSKPKSGALVVLNKNTGESIWEMTFETAMSSAVGVFGKYVFFGTGWRTVVPGSFYVLKVGH